MWTVGDCGAITSIVEALANIDGTGPLSKDGAWGITCRLEHVQ